MKVGDLVTLVKYPGWGVCRIQLIQSRGEKVVYGVQRVIPEGITILMGVAAADITPLPPEEEKKDESR